MHPREKHYYLDYQSYENLRKLRTLQSRLFRARLQGYPSKHLCVHLEKEIRKFGGY